jgi:hypothetical protein
MELLSYLVSISDFSFMIGLLKSGRSRVIQGGLFTEVKF